MRTIEVCRACHSADLIEVLGLGDLYLSAFVDDETVVPSYPLDLVLCRGCTLVQLRHTVPPEEMYRHYWYRSSTNRSMTKELEDIAALAVTWIAEERDRLPEKLVALDIGANDGTLLRAYRAALGRPDDFVTRVGFEPAKNLIAAASEGNNLIINDFFNAAAYHEKMSVPADIVTSIAMFYDLDDPNAFVRDVASVLAPDGVWIIQMADLKSMLDRTMWDNICHEHLEYYSLLSLERLLDAHGFSVEFVEHNDVNGGSIRVFVRKTALGRSPSPSVLRMREEELRMGLDSLDAYTSFAERVISETTELASFITKEFSSGKTIYVYGASTKGNTLLQYVGLKHPMIAAAAERNPDKWGKKTVGSLIPIISEEEARAKKPDYFLVLPWHFLDEFLEREAAYLDAGGAFIVPLPEFRVIRRSNGEARG